MPPRTSLARPDGRTPTEAWKELKLSGGVAAAAAWRRMQPGVAFIAVTGSCGKTTSKELIGSVLGSELRGRRSPAQGNGLAVVGKTILRTGRRDRFCVVEAAAGVPGGLRRTAFMLRPNVVVVTCIGQDHRSLFRTLAATAAEKAQLLAGAAPGALAVLNADDQHVMAMADGFSGRVVTFGTGPAADYRARGARSAWPQRLAFEIEHAGDAMTVQTRLLGKQWVPSVLAAIAVGREQGLPLSRAVEAVSRVGPTPMRMSPLVDHGVTYIRDDVKAPLWTMPPVLEWMAEAGAVRKTLVVGTLSDYSSPSSRVYPALARRALEVCDEVIFAGPQARLARRGAAGEAAARLRVFANVHDAGQHVRATAQAGDLILLKGSKRADGMGVMLPPAAVPV